MVVEAPLSEFFPPVCPRYTKPYNLLKILQKHRRKPLRYLQKHACMYIRWNAKQNHEGGRP